MMSSSHGSYKIRPHVCKDSVQHFQFFLLVYCDIGETMFEHGEQPSNQRANILIAAINSINCTVLALE